MAALGLGLEALWFVALATRVPGGGSTGFPFRWGSPSVCSIPNPFNGCGYAYSLPVVALDYAVWTGAILGILVAVVERGCRRPAAGAA